MAATRKKNTAPARRRTTKKNDDTARDVADAPAGATHLWVVPNSAGSFDPRRKYSHRVEEVIGRYGSEESATAALAGQMRFLANQNRPVTQGAPALRSAVGQPD